MWFLLPVLVAGVGGGIAGFFIGEKRKEEDIYHKIQEEYHKCISNTVGKGIPPQEAKNICSYTSDDISLAKIFLVAGSLVSMGLALYAFTANKSKMKSNKEVEYVNRAV